MTIPFLHGDHIILRQHRALNALHTWLLSAGSMALLAVTAWTIAGATGILYAVAIGIMTLVAAQRISPTMVLRMYKAEPVTPFNFPEGYRLINELADRAGLPATPKLHVVPSRMLNAFAVGRRDDSAIAVTDGLLRSVTLRELAGVLAHETTHIANEDIKVMALADMVSRMTSTLSTVGMLAILFNLSGFFGHIPWLGVLAMIFAPTIGGLLQLALSRTREFDADYGAALLTGDPDGLASALIKLEQAHGRRWEGMVLPGGRIPDPSILRTHPPTEERIARLMELKSALGPQTAMSHATPGARLPRGRSPVPQIRLSRRERDLFDHWLSLAGELPEREPLTDDSGCSGPACADGLNPWERHGKGPRIRIRRGGVWW
ncbi:zinc metalloprotease HtpX [Oricola thermophila]|uniref:M48 family metalloprotease n=1 Tax=Oricola thermophila TaxID=2742145 RepID=A0A6N1VG56_9HYPH|nr:zinc metalloprotease HtpX [Oricola thermophila]QKV19778.1 M48 family metalloprotease [Oricola thermophila]